MALLNTYGDISPRTAAFAQKELLKRALPYLVFERFGQGRPIPGNSTKTTKWRRYEALDNTPKALVEGVTPNPSKLVATDVTATLTQYGDGITITDVIQDTHEDPVFSEAQTILGEQAAQMIERVRYGVLRAGTNVIYANGKTSRGAVVDSISTSDLRLAVRALKRQNVKPFTTMLKSSPNYGSQAIPASYVAVVHPDLESDLRALTGFKAVEDYGSATPLAENEIGAFNYIRFLTSTIIAPFADAGGSKGTMLSTSGTSADVYPILIFGRDAYGLVPLKGKMSADIMVVNPKPSDSDPWAQRGWVTWKSMQTAAILNDFWMIRIETAVKATPA